MNEETAFANKNAIVKVIHIYIKLGFKKNIIFLHSFKIILFTINNVEIMVHCKFCKKNRKTKIGVLKI